MDGINFHFIPPPPPVWLEIHLQILAHGKRMAKPEAPDRGVLVSLPRPLELYCVISLNDVE